jgi:cytosine/adenosine deaminase-related metal-dependent hydrolase
MPGALTAHVLRARYVFVDASTVLAPGEVVFDGGRIVALRAARGRVDDVALLPGLVNAHAHLQLPAMPAAPHRFLPWLQTVIQTMASAGAPQLRANARRSLQRLGSDGCTAVGDIDSSGLGPGLLAAAGFGGRCYREVLGFDLDARGGRRLVRERAAGGGGFPAGLAPHAPYSVSPALFAAAARRARWLQIHLAESAEEVEFLRTGRGPFRDLLQGLGRLPDGFVPFRRRPLEHLQALGLLRRGTLLVHCQHLAPGDTGAIAGSGAAIAVCPGTIRWFRRPPPPVGAWLRAGIRVALGTDSHASNTALSMPGELAAAAALWPGLSPSQLLTMATAHGGQALGRPGLGRLALGGRADLFRIAAGAPRAAEVLAQFVHGKRPVLRTWNAGRPRPGAAVC